VEIKTLKAHGEVELLIIMAAQVAEPKKRVPGVLAAYLRNVRLKLFSKSRCVIQGAEADKVPTPF
jgi:hypothetical protein